MSKLNYKTSKDYKRLKELQMKKINWKLLGMTIVIIIAICIISIMLCLLAIYYPYLFVGFIFGFIASYIYHSLVEDYEINKLVNKSKKERLTNQNKEN